MEWAAAALSGAGKVADYFSGRDKQKADEAIARANIEAQREFAQQGIRWKVNDALAAGVHPLAALGASTTSFSPVQVGGGGQSTDFSGMGQDFGRAMMQMQQKEERAAQLAKDVAKEGLEGAKIDNEIKKTELASRVARLSQELGPGMPGGWISMVDGSRSPRRAGGFAMKDKDMEVAETSGPTVKTLPLWGLYDLKTNPKRASAQTIEDEYGEGVVANTLSAGNFVSDIAHTFGQSDAYKALPGLWTGRPGGYFGRSASKRPRARRSRPWGE